MGGDSSKQQQSSEVERNRRLREFEEELIVEDQINNHTIHSLQPQYFHQFLNDPSSDRNSLKSRNKETLLDDDDAGLEPEVEDPINNDNKEVEDAIAELEETFKTLSSSSPEDQGFQKEDKFNKSSDDEDMMNSSRSKSCGPPTSSSLPGGNHHHRLGTPMGIGNTNNSSPYSQSVPQSTTPTPGRMVVTTPQRNLNSRHNNRHRRRINMGGGRGGIGGSRSSGGLVVAGGGEVESSKSAPPWAQQQSWSPPEIHGFDVDKFRELNQRESDKNNSSKRLPNGTSNTREQQDVGQPVDFTYLDDNEEEEIKNNKRPATPYTKDELDLLKKLEREVC